MITDVIKSTLPPKENHELAEDLLARFPGFDRAELLKKMIAYAFFDMRHGNKREERAACDFLNEFQVQAEKLKPNQPTIMKLDELLTKITPLPWKWDGDDIWHIGHSYDDKDNPHSYSGIKADTRLHKSPILAANKEYIIAAANVLPKLVEAGHELLNHMSVEARLDARTLAFEDALKLATNLDSVTNRKPESQKTK